MSTSTNDSTYGGIHWPDEAEAVINDIKHHVRHIFISNALPTTESEIYLNCETIETERYTIRLSADGFQIAGTEFDTNTDNNGIAYETPYALLNIISPGYVSSFGSALSKALSDLVQN